MVKQLHKKILRVFIALLLCNISFAQKSSDQLAKELSNPVANLINVPFQQNFDFDIGEARGSKYLLNFQPVIPVSISKNLGLINRVIIPFVTQNNVISNSNQTGLGDISYSAFLAPNLGKFILGIGPVVSIPSATDSLIGSKKLGIGPSLVALTQTHSMTIGALLSNTWSVAGADHRPDFNILFAQPFFAVGFNGGFTMTLISENTYDWKSKILTSGMVGLTASQVFKIGKSQAASIAMGPKYFYANSRVDKPDWGMRVALTLVFAE